MGRTGRTGRKEQRAVAQMAARSLWEREDAGSNPVGPTMECGAQWCATGLENRAVGNGEGSTPSRSAKPP